MASKVTEHNYTTIDECDAPDPLEDFPERIKERDQRLMDATARANEAIKAALARRKTKGETERPAVKAAHTT